MNEYSFSITLLTIGPDIGFFPLEREINKFIVSNKKNKSESKTAIKTKQNKKKKCVIVHKTIAKI